MADRVQLRRDSLANWTTYNPILADGEFGIETDTVRFRIGNGVDNFLDLPYANAGDVSDLFNKTTDTLDDITDGTLNQKLLKTDKTSYDNHLANSNIHFLESTIDHNAIQNIGANSHTDIDTHISNSDIHQTTAQTIEQLGVDSGDPHGFISQTAQALSFVDATRTFNIIPTGVDYSYYISGVKTTIDVSKDIVIPDLEGEHFIYMDSAGTLFVTQDIGVVFGGPYVFVSVLYWDASNNESIYFARETHSTEFPKEVWIYNHLTFGTQHRTGMSLTNFNLGGGDLDIHAQFLINSGSLADEDLEHNLEQQTQWPIFYKEGANGYWRSSALTTFGVQVNTGRALYNEFTGATWQQTEVANNDFVLAHVFATNSSYSNKKYIIVQGQSQYTSTSNAREGATTEISNLITTGLPFAEFLPVASIIFQTGSGYNNAVKSRIVTTDTGDNYVNWIGSALSPSSSPSAHGNLTGLLNDDHPQYAFNDGLSAGFTTLGAYVDNGDGSITVPNENVNLFATTNKSGRITQYVLAGTTLSDLVDQDTNYIVGDYNSGTPIFRTIQDVLLINESTVVPYLTIFRDGNDLLILEWDTLGTGLSNNLHARFAKTQRFARQSGLALAETGTRNIAISSGIVWNGANVTSVPAMDTSIADTYDFYYHVGGTWTKLASQTQYNNTQYDDGTDLVTLSNNKYAVNWIYRGVSTSNHMFVVLGGGDYTLAEALDSPMPSDLPTIISTHAILVGRIIVQKNGASADAVQTAFDTVFSSVTAQVHNDLGGIQGGAVDEYYHLTSSEYTKLGRGYVTKTSSYTATSLDKFVFIDASLTNVDITLPSAASVAGLDLTIKLIDDTNTGRIIGTLDGQTNYTLILNETIKLISNGTNWYIV